MPLKLSVNVSRKMGLPNFSSAGAGLNLELEVDTSLLERPEELQAKVRTLYKLTDSAVREEIARQLAVEAPESAIQDTRPGQTGVQPAAGNGHAAGNGNGQGRATVKQVDLICKLAGERLAEGPGGLNQLCTDQAGVVDVHHLSKNQASELIKHLFTLPERSGTAATSEKS